MGNSQGLPFFSLKEETLNFAICVKIHNLNNLSSKQMYSMGFSHFCVLHLQLILRGLETHNGISGPDHLNIAEHQSGTSPKQPFLWTGLVPITNFDCELYPQIVDS